MASGEPLMVVDDEPGVCKSCAKILKREGFDVETFTAATDALKAMAEKEYKVVITDLMMPEMDGMELLERIHLKYPRTSVIMITGYGTMQTAVEAMKKGAFDFLPKPFTAQELGSVAARAFERAKLGTDQTAADEPKAPVSKDAKGVYYSIREHSWASIDTDGLVKVGVHPVFVKTLGTIDDIDLPPENDEFAAGEPCVRFQTKGKRHAHKLWIPVGGMVAAVNEAPQEDWKVLVEDPFGKGWLLKVNPSDFENDRKCLLLIEPEQP